MNKEISTEQMERFALELTAQYVERADWVRVVRYGLNYLLDNPALLTQIVGRRVAFEVSRYDASTPEVLAEITNELGLKFANV